MFIFDSKSGQSIPLPRGAPMVLRENQFVDERIRTTGWKTKVRAHVEKYLNPSKNFVDVGAHIGTWSLWASEKSAQVYAFEPHRKSFYQLCSNILLNEKEDKIFPTWVGLCMTDHHGCPALCLHPSVNNDASAVVTPLPADSFGKGIKGTDAYGEFQTNILPDPSTLILRTLDSFNLSNVGFLKIAVEGQEFEVISGAVNLIKRERPIIFFECWLRESHKDKRAQLFQILDSLGYSIEHLTQESTPEWTAEDYIAIPKEISDPTRSIVEKYGNASSKITTDSDPEIPEHTDVLVIRNASNVLKMISKTKTFSVLILNDPDDIYRSPLESRGYIQEEFQTPYRVYLSGPC